MTINASFLEKITTSGTSQKFTAELVQGASYALNCVEDTWFVVAATGGSVSATTGSICHAGTRVPICRLDSTRKFLHVLQVADAGVAILEKLEPGA